MLKKLFAFITALVLAAGGLSAYAEANEGEVLSPPPHEKWVSDYDEVEAGVLKYIKDNGLDARVVPPEEKSVYDRLDSVTVQGDEKTVKRIMDYSTLQGYIFKSGSGVVTGHYYTDEDSEPSPEPKPLAHVDGFEVLNSFGSYTWNEKLNKQSCISDAPDKDAVYVKGWFGTDFNSCITYSAGSLCRLNNEDICKRLKDWYRDYSLTDDMREKFAPGTVCDIAILRNCEVNFFDESGEQITIMLSYIMTDNYGTVPAVRFSFDDSSHRYSDYRYEIVGDDCPLLEIFEGIESFLGGLDKAVDYDFLTGDINGDDALNVSDISRLAAQIKGIKPVGAEKMKFADTNADGKINVTDMTTLAAKVKGIGSGIRDNELICGMLTKYAQKKGIMVKIEPRGMGTELSEHSRQVVVHLNADDPDNAEKRRQLEEFMSRKMIDRSSVFFYEETEEPMFTVIKSNAEKNLDDTDIEKWLDSYGDRQAAYGYTSRAVSPEYYSSGSLCKALDDSADNRLRAWYENFKAPAETVSGFAEDDGSAVEKLYFFDSSRKQVTIERSGSIIKIDGKAYDAASLTDCPAAEIFAELRSCINELDSGITDERYTIIPLEEGEKASGIFDAPLSAYENRCVYIWFKSPETVSGSFVRLNSPADWRNYSDFAKQREIPAAADYKLSDNLPDSGISAEIYFRESSGKPICLRTQQRLDKDGNICFVFNDGKELYMASDLPMLDLENIVLKAEGYLDGLKAE
ncbi:dockerin type I repeat-containing protein [Ruminococcus sp.]|uniref:dockerin type I repeat-containing protein n=1 Tax=Ruminococcus sp. TaxID=41978 RepID=UPI001AFF4E29|nr:dockerin type I repeat-containing protein [Ruminococcus sp.]MBO5558218.1 dockerin type I repeat-containing protein [Ruminococcus sp.]